MFDVVSMGEVVIDFSLCGKGNMGNPAYEMNPGGAPANCLVANAALGGKTAFIGMVGNDTFGHFLHDSLAKYHVENRGIRFTDAGCTQLTFVDIDETGDRSFNFAKGTGTDAMLTVDDIDFSLIDETKIFHTPCVISRCEPGRTTVLAALKYAKEKGKIISCDPNYRPGRWLGDKERAKRHFLEVMQYSDLVKVSEEEMSIITGVGEDEYEKGAKMILDSGKTAVFVTMGPNGAYYATKEDCGYVEGFKVNAVDTTGSGDAFMGTVHYYFTHDCGLPIREIVRRANAMGALCATKPGAFDARPTKEALYHFLGVTE